MKLHVVNAAEGDCLLLESGDTTPRFALVDGGPPGNYDKFGRRYLADAVGPAGKLDLAIVSHVDADHIVGVLDLLAHIEEELANERPAITITDLWHNSFTESVDTPAQDISQGIQALLDAAGAEKMALALGQTVFYGIGQGVRLALSARRLGIPVNHAFDGALISPDSVSSSVHSIGDLNLQVVGPTDANLRQLQREWLEWLAKHSQSFAAEGPTALANADRSIPNLSSIVLLVSDLHHRMLLTGDARGDHILDGLEEAGLLDDEGSIHLDLLKVQHHGSNRNATKTFFRKVTADRYVVSANGKNGNPDLETLEWIVTAASGATKPIDIYVTNETPSLDELRAQHPPAASNYRLHVGTGASQVIDFQ